jgi:hypothetical protein
MHWDQERQRKLVHLTREDLGWLESVADVLDVVVDDRVATLAHA